MDYRLNSEYYDLFQYTYSPFNATLDIESTNKT